MEDLKNDVSIHPHTKTLLQKNKTFQKYPINNSKQTTRQTLPHTSHHTNDTSLWTIIKENIGKDLSRITVPVQFNEPLSMVQKTITFLEYKHLLNKANLTKDPGLRCAYLLTPFFLIYAHTIGTVKKPFNSMLGETYEYQEPEDGLKVIVEQVSHHPPISAFYIENAHFKCEGYLLTKTQFSLRNFLILPVGKTIFTLKSTNQKYEIQRAETTLHNYIIGDMYVWHQNEMSCKNLETGEIAILNLEPKGWTNSCDYHAKGEVRDSQGKVTHKLDGKWDSQLNAFNVVNKQKIVLGKVSEEKAFKEYF